MASGVAEGDWRDGCRVSRKRYHTLLGVGEEEAAVMGQGSGLWAVVGSIALAVTAFSAQNVEHGTRTQLESRYQYIITSVESLQLQLQRFARAAKESEDQLQWLRGQLDQERAKAQLSQSDLTLQGETLGRLRSQIAELEATKQQLEDRLRRASEQLTTVLAKPGASSDGSVTLEKIVVESRPATQGNVLMVNPDYNFIVLSVGQADGVRIGDTLGIYRGNRIAARVRVERVRANTSAATVLPGWSISDVREQDVVRNL